MISREEAINLIEDKIGYTLHPAGIHRWNSDKQKKEDVKLGIPFGSEWKDSYTTGKLNLDYKSSKFSKLIILDIDGDKSFKFNDDSTISFKVNSKEYTLPLTAYTQTTKPGNYHFYYNSPIIDTAKLPSRLTGVIKEDVDVLATGVVFEWHSFSPHNEWHFDHNVVDAPREWIEDMASISSAKKYDQALTLVPSHARANIVKEFLKLDNFYFEGQGKQKRLNTFFKLVFPKEYIPLNAKKEKTKNVILWSDFKFSYDLMNKIAVKLTTTAQLDTYKHTIPVLHKITHALLGNKYNEDYTNKILTRNILIGLPEHAAITNYDDDEVVTLEEALDKQSKRVKLVRTIENSAIKYVEVDSITLKPILSEGTFDSTDKRNIYITKQAAEAKHPEFLSQREDGKMGWDDSLLPWVTITNNIYKPRSYIDDNNNDNIVLNTYEPSQYYQNAVPVPEIPNNVYTRAIAASLGTVDSEGRSILYDRETDAPINVIEYYHRWMARAMFSNMPPKIKLWMAALGSQEGGAGKSMAGIDFPAKVMGNVVVQQTKQNMINGWGDNVVNARVVSLEDLERLNQGEFDMLYGLLKRMGGNASVRLNMKGNKYVDVKLKIGMTLSSNWRPSLPQSDRWIVALEPAWLHGFNNNISAEDIADLSGRLTLDEFDQDAQDVVNYWRYLYENETEEWKLRLNTFAPVSTYRKLWVGASQHNVKSIVSALPHPDILTSMFKLDRDVPLDHIAFMVANYNEKTQTTAIPWMWFEKIAETVASNSGIEWSKKGLEHQLDIDFQPIGVLYREWLQNEDWGMKNGIKPSLYMKWSANGYTLKIKKEDIEGYKEWLKQQYAIQSGQNKPYLM